MRDMKLKLLPDIKTEIQKESEFLKAMGFGFEALKTAGEPLGGYIPSVKKSIAATVLYRETSELLFQKRYSSEIQDILLMSDKFYNSSTGVVSDLPAATDLHSDVVGAESIEAVGEELDFSALDAGILNIRAQLEKNKE